jgi:CDP-glucose 4,6-dehydratase
MVIVTTDNCYENKEWIWGYRENEPIGGNDPYSNSKGCSELVTAAYRNSFFNVDKYQAHGVALATARAGNVIGGGDISEDRLIPDILRSFKLKKRVEIRNPNALRPWQHVLDPLYGYILIGKKILNKEKLSDSYNFGPSETSQLTVGQMTDIACKNWRGNLGWENIPNEDSMPESKLLWLNSELAERELGWKNQLNAEETLIWTFEWERKSMEMTPSELIDEQFLRYKNII